ncbi:MAG: ATPase, T2SS/T4P/T4SS family [Candidatus Asgardarchaeia archaeon]
MTLLEYSKTENNAIIYQINNMYKVIVKNTKSGVLYKPVINEQTYMNHDIDVTLILRRVERQFSSIIKHKLIQKYEKYSFSKIIDEIKCLIIEVLKKNNYLIVDDSFVVFIIFKLLGLEKLLPYLLDEYITEIYIDRPNTRIYIDHIKFGRCTTTTIVDKATLEKLKNILELENNLSLDTSTPSIKGDLRTDYFHVRVTIDSYPITVDGLAVDIRKYRKKPFTITELVHLGTISPLLASFLIFLMKRKINILIIGRPGSGKTTLANAIDMLTPSYWRKIYIEDVIESIDQRTMGRHQLRLKVESYIGKEKTRYKKSTEIIKLLHRNPDWIFLGEILTKDHSEALFHALVSGITGIETYHAATPLDAILRWNIFHKIPFYAMRNLGLIVLMGRIERKNTRYIRVLEVVEPYLTNSKEKIPVGLNTIFKYDMSYDHIFCVTDNLFHKSINIKRLHKTQNVRKIDFISEIAYYTKTIVQLVKKKDFSYSSLQHLIGDYNAFL